MYFNARVVVAFALAAPSCAASINWYPCNQNASAPVTCGNLAVPLDYADKNPTMKLDLELLKFNATKEPCKGSILFNPGGPGESTKDFLGVHAQEMFIATGGHYNLIAFEPRGLGNTIPFSCFKNGADRAAQLAKVPLVADASDTSQEATWSNYTTIAKECYEAMKDTGSLIGTPYVARDMMQIVDALGEDGKLRYWGFSYGTHLGATVVSMFPDRMDKIVFDGIVNVPEYISGSNREAFLQADDALRAFFRDCLTAPETCALYRQGKTADDMYQEFFSLLETIKHKPMVLGGNLTTDIVEYSAVKNGMYSAVKNGIELSVKAATFLNSIYEKDVETYRATSIASTGGGGVYPKANTEALYGIHCSDTTFRENDFAKMKPLIDYYDSHSQFGAGLWEPLTMACAQWKINSKERFCGPFQAKTKTPILFISSPLDPATPMVSARNMSRGFEGSVILQQKGIGHTSIAHPSTCTIKATQAYFTDGKLPEEGTICEPDFSFLSNHTTLEIYKLADKQAHEDPCELA